MNIRYVEELDSTRVQHKLVRNPNYCSEHVAFQNWCYVPLCPVRGKPKFLAALQQNVLYEGFRNPIVVYAFPEGLMLSFGGSRLMTAQSLALPIPAIVVDFTGEFASCPQVTQENYHTFFEDAPRHFVIDETGVDTHYSLERNRRADFDPAGIAWTGSIEDDSFLKEEFSWLP